jgi:hypothetical protein
MRESPTIATTAASANRPPQSRTGTASKAESGSQRVWRRGTRSTSPKLPCEHRLTFPDPLYFELADRLGLIVWLDMPYMQFLAPATREALKRVFQTSVAMDGHHPSIAIWTLFNEGWGIDLDDNPDDRLWLIETFNWAKTLVPDSLLVDNSPCFPRNYHLKTDIEDFHWYNGFPHQNEDFAATTRAFAGRPAWTFSPHGDEERRGDQPLICSEFGVWGLPHPNEILHADGSEPW